jgi:hypothetical protein
MFHEGSLDDIYPQSISKKIVIDPEKLIKIKRQRQPFKMVKSRFEPSESEAIVTHPDMLLPHPKTVESETTYTS